MEKKILDVKYDFIMTKRLFRESYYGGHTIKKMRHYKSFQWTDKMTNCSDDGQYRLANNPAMPTDPSKIFTNLSLFRREIAEFDNEAKYLAGEDPEKLYRTKINYLGWVLSDLREVVKNSRPSVSLTLTRPLG